MEMMISISDTFLAINPDSVGKIRGFAIVKNVSQPYLWSIAVHPNFQGAGIGGCLLRNIITQYTQTGSKEITLHVAADNPAQRLYFDHGFRVKNVEENYFDPIDGLVMVKKL
jgi:ribosomal protein S18 acetylase RimI-like enzyme